MNGLFMLLAAIVNCIGIIVGVVVMAVLGLISLTLLGVMMAIVRTWEAVQDFFAGKKG